MLRWQQVENTINEAVNKSGRKRQDVTLIAVSKTRTLAEIDRLASYGQCDFGENRVQELQTKILERPHLKWHMIGRLQTNKVKYIIDQIVLLHSLDRWKLALEIEKKAAEAGIYLPALVQVNISGEASKAGLSPAEVSDFCHELQQFEHIQLKGLMTIAPLGSSGLEAQPYFRKLRDLRDELRKHSTLAHQLPHLSMGMSGDFKEAIAEGATMIRVGSALFGPRDQ